MEFLWSDVLMKTYLVCSERVWINITIPLSGFHSFICYPPPQLPSPYPSCVSLSVWSWHIGSLPDHQPVSSDSSVWQSSSAAHSSHGSHSTLPYCKSCVHVTNDWGSTWATNHHWHIQHNLIYRDSTLCPNSSLNISCINSVMGCAAVIY